MTPEQMDEFRDELREALGKFRKFHLHLHPADLMDTPDARKWIEEVEDSIQEVEGDT